MTTDEIIVALAERLGKERMLDEQESRWLETSLRRLDRRAGREGWARKVRWTVKDDVALKRHLGRNRRAKDIARAMGKSEDAIWSRIKKLRREGKLPMVQRPMARCGAEG